MSNPSLAQAMSCLSVATDFAMGQAAGFGLRSCVLALRLADALGWDARGRDAVYYQALLRYIGCNVETQTLAALVGDEIGLRRAVAGMDGTDKPDVMRRVWRQLQAAHRQQPWLTRTALSLRTMATLEQEMARQFRSHCDVGRRLADRMGLDAEVVRGLGHLYERWDGKGLPAGLKGEAVAPAALLVALVQDVLVHADLDGPDAAFAMAQARRGKAYAPAHVDALRRLGPAALDGLDGTPRPAGPDAPLDDERFDAVCAAMADFVDIKSPWTMGHSTGVAALAARAAEQAGAEAAEVRLLRRAGWLHDLGKVGVSAAVWCKPGRWNASEYEQARLHAYYSERILAGVPALAPVAELASLVHDRLDGSGYFRRPPAAGLSRQARLLAAADAAHGALEARPHRDGLPAAQAVERLQGDAKAGRLDTWAVDRVAEALGQPAAPLHLRRDRLTAREEDVLRCLARGQPTKQIARELGLAPKTVDHHQQAIFGKLGLNSRGAAMLYAMENGYCDTLH